MTKRIVSGESTVWTATKRLMKSSAKVDKIVICGRDFEENERLIASIGMISPECEIQIPSKGMEHYEDVPVGPKPGTLKNGGKSNAW